MEHDPAAHIIMGIVILDDTILRHVVKIECHSIHSVLAVAHFVILEYHIIRTVAPDPASIALCCLLECIDQIVLYKAS